MSRPLTTLKAAWQRFWARETLPAAPPPDRSTPHRPSLLRTLLARDELPAAAPARGPDRSFLRTLLAGETVPAPTDPSSPAEPE